MVTMRLELEEGLHRRLKVWSFKNGFTMATAVRRMIGEKVGHDERSAAITKIVGPENKDLVERLVPPEVPMSKCRKCFDVFPVADMVTDPKSGKLFCGSCVENMRNQQ